MQQKLSRHKTELAACKTLASQATVLRLQAYTGNHDLNSLSLNEDNAPTSDYSYFCKTRHRKVRGSMAQIAVTGLADRLRRTVIDAERWISPRGFRDRADFLPYYVYDPRLGCLLVAPREH